MRRAGVTADDLLAATRHYAFSVKDTEAQFIKHGSTFFGSDKPFSDFIAGVPGTAQEANRKEDGDHIAAAQRWGAKFADTDLSLEVTRDLLEAKKLPLEQFEAALAAFTEARNGSPLNLPRAEV